MQWNHVMPIALVKKLWDAWNARYTVTQHVVRCPEYDCDTTVVVKSKTRPRGARHVDVTACSVFQHEPIYPPSKMVWVPDVTSYAVPRLPAGYIPAYDLSVPCHKRCLYVLNDEIDTGNVRRGRCISGSIDCVELERQITRNTVAESATTRSPWSYL